MQTRRWKLKKTTGLLAMLAMLGLAGCREQAIGPPVHHTNEEVRTFRSFGTCGTDNTPIIPITTRQPHEPGRVLAGYQSVFWPGAEPLPCNRLLTMSAQAQMLFTGTVDAAIRTRPFTAFLEISRFEPSAPLRMTDARPWGTGVTGGWTGETRESCRFKVKTFSRTLVDPHPSRHGQTWVESEDLTMTSNSQFWVPLARPALVNVTNEARRALRDDEVNLRLVLEPSDAAMGAQATNDCYGRFTVQLKFFAADD
jgi:hypothetical protein